MKIRTSRTSLILVAATASLSLFSCVDNDYDLSKDVDMNVTVGGNITLPPSSSEPYTMAQILDLDANSSIKPVGQNYGLAQGDYVLVQDGNTSPSDFRIGEVTIQSLAATEVNLDLGFQGVGTNARVSIPVTGLSNAINLEDNNVDRQLVSISEAQTDIQMNINFRFATPANYTGNVYIESGFHITFPAGWYIRDNSTDGYTEVTDGNILRFKRERATPAGSTLSLSVTVERIDFTKMNGQVLNNGRFLLSTSIVTAGSIGVENGSLAAGESSKVTLTISPRITKGVITAVTGQINPSINIDPTSFTISDVPDFLKEPGNNLDILNPQINLNVTNTSPVEVNINGLLRAVEGNGAVHEVWVGDQHGTAPIIVKGNGTSEICLSTLGTGGASGAVNVAIPGLSSLINTIPDRIEMTQIEAKVPQDKEFTLQLAPTYNFTMDYTAVVPLAFGSDLRFTYTKKDTGWDEDLDKYNFSTIVATIKVENTAPLDMKPTVQALDKDGNVISDITATVTGTAEAGSLSSPTVSTLEVTLKSNSGNIGRLGGVEFKFDSTANPAFVGVPLNEKQALKFTEIVLTIQGGVDIDLN